VLVRLKSRHLLDIDVKRVQEQPAIRRIRATVGRPVVKQRVQRIEPDTVGAQLGRHVDQASKVAKIADAPVASRPDPIKLDGKQPATVETAGEGRCRRNDQRRIVAHPSGIDQVQTVRTVGQINWPVDHAISGIANALESIAFRDYPVARNYFPSQRERGSLFQLRPRLAPEPDHDRSLYQRVRRVEG
jgi:hypothetical protein